MLNPSPTRRIWACAEPASMRKSFDGLYASARQSLNRDPHDGDMICSSPAIGPTDEAEEVASALRTTMELAAAKYLRLTPVAVEVAVRDSWLK